MLKYLIFYFDHIFQLYNICVKSTELDLIGVEYTGLLYTTYEESIDSI